MTTLHILFTADMHNKLTKEKAAIIRQWKKKFSPDVLLLDAGDAIASGNLGANSKEPIFDLMDFAGFDAMAMGNRETHPTQSAMHKKLGGAKLPVLAANLRARQDKRPPRCVNEYLEFAVGDEDDDDVPVIAVFGLCPVITAPDSFWAKVTDYVFDDPLKTGPGLAHKLSYDADLVVALTHIGYDRDIQLAECADIDLIIGGHTHRQVMPAEKHGHAWFASVEPFAVSLAHLAIDYTPGEGIHSIKSEIIPLGDSEKK
jgi:2',3'-cyclic-nucleotide 2'-phosphodiesterase (5'-nucleotidase family)